MFVAKTLSFEWINWKRISFIALENCFSQGLLVEWGPSRFDRTTCCLGCLRSGLDGLLCDPNAVFFEIEKWQTFFSVCENIFRDALLFGLGPNSAEVFRSRMVGLFITMLGKMFARFLKNQRCFQFCLLKCFSWRLLVGLNPCKTPSKLESFYWAVVVVYFFLQRLILTCV